MLVRYKDMQTHEYGQMFNEFQYLLQRNIDTQNKDYKLYIERMEASNAILQHQYKTMSDKIMDKGTQLMSLAPNTTKLIEDSTQLILKELRL